MERSSRRRFLKSSVTAACSAALGGGAAAELLAAAPTSAAVPAAGPASLSIKKGLVFSMLPATLSVADRFKMAPDVGFDLVQSRTEPNGQTAEALKTAP